MQLFRTKPLEKILAEAEESGEGTLRKTLGATALTLLGVGAIIGTGIFVNTQDPRETIAFIKEHFENPDYEKIRHLHRAVYKKGV